MGQEGAHPQATADLLCARHARQGGNNFYLYTLFDHRRVDIIAVSNIDSTTGYTFTSCV